MSKQSTFSHVLQNFRPASDKKVVVWIHTNSNEHFVGISSYIDLTADNVLTISFDWMLQAEPNDDPRWRPVPGSKKRYPVISIAHPRLESATDDRLKMLDYKEEIDLCIGADHLAQAARILKRYESF